MNRGSTAGFVPPSVYIGFPLFVLAKGRSGHLSTIPWRARRTVGFWATRPVGILFCSAPPRPAAPPCAAPTGTARGMFGFWNRQIRSVLIACVNFCIQENSNTAMLAKRKSRCILSARRKCVSRALWLGAYSPGKPFQPKRRKLLPIPKHRNKTGGSGWGSAQRDSRAELGREA